MSQVCRTETGATHATNGAKVGPYSNVGRLLNVDGRTRLGKLMRDVRAALSEHVGGEPNAAQQLIIHQATIKTTRLILLEKRILSELGLEEGDTHQWLAWSNSLRRDLEALGIASKVRNEPRLAEYIEAAQ